MASVEQACSKAQRQRTKKARHLGRAFVGLINAVREALRTTLPDLKASLALLIIRTIVVVMIIVAFCSVLCVEFRLKLLD